MPTLKRAEVELYYESSGMGPPVLFIQGVGVVGECWRPQVNALKESFQCLLFDNRGIGKSAPCNGPISIAAMAEDAVALLDALGLESAHVVGHSMGGIIAQQLALDHLKRVRSLSLLCTFPRGKDATRLTPYVLWMTLRTRLGSRRMRRRAFLEMLIPKADLEAADLDVLAVQVASLIGRDLADQPSILTRQLIAMARHDSLSRLGELAKIPTLVLSTEYDRIATTQCGRKLADAIPGARYEAFPAASHGVTFQKPRQINQILQRFLNSVEPVNA